MAAALGASVVGLGNMGTAIAERLLDAGHPLGVFNRSIGVDFESQDPSDYLVD